MCSIEAFCGYASPPVARHQAKTTLEDILLHIFHEYLDNLRLARRNSVYL